MKLEKQEYEILYYISRGGRNSLERLEGMFDSKVVLRAIEKLSKLGLIKISYRDNKIYGFMETTKGDNLLISEEYKDWYYEMGD